MPLGAEGSLLMETSRRWSAGAIVTSILAVIGILVLLFWGTPGPVSTNPGKGAAAQLPIPSPTPTPKPTPVCSNTWPMITSVHLKNRWFAEGIASITDAKTNADAVAAAPDFTEKVSQEASLLVGAAKAFHLPDVDVASLTDSKGCATDATVKLKIALDVARATARSITLSEAPTNGTNTGVENGQVVSDPGGTIGGNRKAIQIVLSDGTTIWIMARCGNIVTSGPPIFPPGKTDNPCPPGNEIPDCAPKSTHAKDYTLPEAKPSVTNGPVPVEIPPVVVTTVPGGGGVVDTPTNTPGTETGTTAPGATAPPPTPTPIPVNQGGDNGAGDPGGM